MINEELKTFISKMRAAGKADDEIVSALRTAGWEERAINQELSPKARLNFAKVKFWLLLYGIAILLFLIFLLVNFLFGSTFPGKPVADIILFIFMIYAFGIVPLVTLLAIGFKLLFWILRFIPYFKNLKSFELPNHKWLLVIGSAVTGAIMLWVGYLGMREPNAGMAVLITTLIAVAGGVLLILSLIFTVVLIVANKDRATK